MVGKKQSVVWLPGTKNYQVFEEIGVSSATFSQLNLKETMLQQWNPSAIGEIHLENSGKSSSPSQI